MSLATKILSQRLVKNTCLFFSGVGAILANNPIGKINQHVMYSSILLNYAERTNITMEREVLVMVYALHKFRHYMLGNRFTLYVNHMALVYLVNKP